MDFGYVTAWLPVRDLELQPDVEATIAKAPKTPPPSLGVPLASMSEEVVAARRAILALKLGQVLEENVHELSVGVDEVRADMERAIDAAARRRPQCLLVEGSWGTGKTHLLTMLARLAVERDFATAAVILDGEGITLSEPMGLMEAVLGSLRYPGETAPYGVGSRLASLRRLPFSGDVWRSVGSKIYGAIHELPLRAFDEPEALEVLEDYFMLTLAATRANEKLRLLGYRLKLPPLKAHIRYERPQRFCELLKGWAGFCRFTGAKGLVVVFDEVDVEYATVFGRNPRFLRKLFLRAFDGLLRDSCPILLAFGSAPASVDLGPADDAVQDLVQSINGMTRIEAPGPSVAHTKELGVRLHELYSRAYPRETSAVEAHKIRRQIERFAERHYDETLLPTPRGFVRGTLELLDVLSE